jgi:glycosyltransferase involved in cell wall biosynthesis
VQNGIRPHEFEPVEARSDAADLLYVGELRAAKGIDTLIDATAALTDSLGRPLSLVLVGTGPDQTKLEQQAAARGIANQVSFAGALPAREAFTRGRVLVVPSRAESLPYIVLEAAGAQIPMIATDVGGIGEVFGPYRDRLIRPDDAPLLAQTIEAMLAADPQARQKQATALSDFVATRFSTSIMAESVIAGYRDGIARRAAGARVSGRSYALPS